MFYRFFLIFVAFMSMSCYLPAQKIDVPIAQRQRLLSLYDEMSAIYVEKNYAKAEMLCEQLIEIYNNELPVDWFYANCLLLNDKFEKAKFYISKVFNNNRFEKAWLSGAGFDRVKTQAIGFWIDSLYATIPSKCSPMIDSLRIMVDIDQLIRKDYMDTARLSTERDSLEILMMQIDSINTRKLQNLIDQYGFPTWKLLGYDGAHNAWLIAQHANLTFQEWYLPRMQQAVDEYNASPHDLAYLIDRVLVKKKLPQRYATQTWSSGLSQPIEDVENLNNRRASMYLEPLDISVMKIADSY